MPNNQQRLIGAITSIGITVGGAWLASQISSTVIANAGVVQASADDNLVVQIEGVRNTNGKIVIVVFDDNKTFQNYDVTQSAGYREVDAETKLTVSFPNLKAGPYVVSVFHDENGNQGLDYQGETPLEGYATSGATDPSATPSFEEAAIKPGVVSIKLNYLK